QLKRRFVAQEYRAAFPESIIHRARPGESNQAALRIRSIRRESSETTGLSEIRKRCDPTVRRVAAESKSLASKPIGKRDQYHQYRFQARAKPLRQAPSARPLSISVRRQAAALAQGCRDGM